MVKNIILYSDFLKENRACPFCDLKSNEIVKENEFAVLTLAQAPYHEDHLIVSCKKHYMKLNEMSSEERSAVDSLVYYGMEKLHKKYVNVTMLYREGNLKEVGKSVEHLHYHLIPELQIGVSNYKDREMFSDEVFAEKISKFREEFIKVKG